MSTKFDQMCDPQPPPSATISNVSFVLKKIDLLTCDKF